MTTFHSRKSRLGISSVSRGGLHSALALRHKPLGKSRRATLKSAAMRRSSDSARGPARRLVVITAVLVGLAALVGWLLFVGVTWRGPVRVVAAEVRQPNLLALIVDSCQANPEVSLVRETSEQVEVEVVATRTFRFVGGGGDCQDLVEVQLQDPLGNRAVVDLHFGKAVGITKIEEAPSR